jgi:hypothetical protein
MCWQKPFCRLSALTNLLNLDFRLLDGEMQPDTTYPDISLNELHEGLEKAQQQAKSSSAFPSPAVPRFSLELLSALKELTLKDLRGGVVHLGHYILLRLVRVTVKPKRLVASVEDKDGRNACLVICNGMPPLRKGTVIAVKVSPGTDLLAWADVSPAMQVMSCALS